MKHRASRRQQHPSNNPYKINKTQFVHKQVTENQILSPSSSPKKKKKMSRNNLDYIQISTRYENGQI